MLGGQSIIGVSITSLLPPLSSIIVIWLRKGPGSRHSFLSSFFLYTVLTRVLEGNLRITSQLHLPFFCLRLSHDRSCVGSLRVEQND